MQHKERLERNALSLQRPFRKYYFYDGHKKVNSTQVHIAHSAVGVKEVLPGNLLVFGIYRSMSTVIRYYDARAHYESFFCPKNKSRQTGYYTL